MASSNLVKLEGNVGKDATNFQTAGSNDPGVFLFLAVANSGRTNDPTWVKCFAYGNVALGMRKLMLRKGNRLAIEGELRVDKDNNLFVKVFGGTRIAKK